MINMTKRIELRKGPPPAMPSKQRRKTTNKVRSKRTTLPDGKDRLNLQIDEDLKEWAKDYAKRHHTTLTQLIADHFVSLRDKELGEGVEQI